MNSDDFFDSISRKDIEITILPKTNELSKGLDNEALFQLPLIAMIILLISKNRRKADVSEIGNLVGDLIEDTMLGFKASSQHLGWSANLRIRTVSALNFLEVVNLIHVCHSKKLNITELGKKVIDRALSYDSDLSYTLGMIERAYRNKCVDKKLDGELI